MGERIFVVTDREKDPELFKKALDPKRFDVCVSAIFCDIENMISDAGFSAILADYDFAGEMVSGWMNILQEKKSGSCLILYGEKNSPENISELLQKGAYGFIPRDLLADRVYDTLMGGLENRKAFIEILAMMDDMRKINQKLEDEKTTLRKRNMELDFINRLSGAISYDLNWNGILPRIISAGLPEIIDSEAVSILYRLDSKWNFDCLPHGEQKDLKSQDELRKEAADNFFMLCGERIAMRENQGTDYFSEDRFCPPVPVFLSDRAILPLSPGGRIMGVLVIYGKKIESYANGNREILSTISNILAMSLDNAEKYHKVKKLTVRDALTGVYNRMGFREFMEKEFLKARRYNKQLSLIMIDLNEFKAINDSFGHMAGDYVLKELVNCLGKNLRKTDILARYGGDEFAIILPETKIETAEMLISRALSAVRNHNFEWKSEKIKVALSWGIASSGEIRREDGIIELIELADSRLYCTKRSKNLYLITENERRSMSAVV